MGTFLRALLPGKSHNAISARDLLGEEKSKKPRWSGDKREAGRQTDKRKESGKRGKQRQERKESKRKEKAKTGVRSKRDRRASCALAGTFKGCICR